MSGRLRLLDLAKPFLPILPEVQLPYQKVKYDDRILYSASACIAYYVMSELPIYGAKITDSPDPVSWLRPVLASYHGSLLEFGIGPIVATGFVFQLLGGFQLIDVDYDLRSDRELFQSAQKSTWSAVLITQSIPLQSTLKLISSLTPVFAILLTFAQSVLFVLSGVYGTPSELGMSKTFILIVQLFLAGLFVILMDETLEKGYGFTSGIVTFSGLSISQRFLWSALSLQSVNVGRGREFTGAFVALVHLLWTRNYKNALIEAFYRTHLPNVFEVYGGILVFLFTVYLLNFRIDIPIKSSKARTPSSSFPIRLLYTGNTPILMYAAVLSQILSISASLFRIFPQNLLVRLVGTWAVRPESHQYVAVSGLAYYLQPPFSLVEGLWDPIRSVIYVLTVIVSCVAFAKTWTEFSGSSARDMAKVFKDNGIVIVGHRENSVQRELKRIIPAAAAVGGAVVGATVAATDLLGLSGVGLSMFAGVTLLYTFYEIISQEQQGAAMPGQ